MERFFSKWLNASTIYFKSKGRLRRLTVSKRSFSALSRLILLLYHLKAGKSHISMTFKIFDDLLVKDNYCQKHLQEGRYTFLFDPDFTILYCYIVGWNFGFVSSIINYEIRIKSKNKTSQVWWAYGINIFLSMGIDYFKKEFYLNMFYVFHCSSRILGIDGSFSWGVRLFVYFIKMNLILRDSSENKWQLFTVEFIRISATNNLTAFELLRTHRR